MAAIPKLNIARHTAPSPATIKNEQAEAQERNLPTLPFNYKSYKTDNTASAADKQSTIYKSTIYGSDTVKSPGGSYTLNERKHSIDAYASRIKTQIKNIENGSEGERNVKFQDVRLFMEPGGYFSAGLLAAGLNPHEEFTVTFNTYVGMGTGKNKTSSDSRTYLAWEIAAGVLDHDKPARGGIVNFHSMVIKKEDKSKIEDLKSLGKQLQDHWERDIATPMRGSAAENSAHDVSDWIFPLTPVSPLALLSPESKISTVIPERAGKADAYVARGAMQSLRNDKKAFQKLSPAAQKAISRTLDKNGQVIIPNIYGYHLSGYAFVPKTPYDGDAKSRPNQGVMIDLKNGTFREINGDEDVAKWAKDNRDTLITRFNASDLQGGKDAHWPSAVYVLDCLIKNNDSTFPGRNTLLSDKSVPVRELFNYTESRDDDYQLKFGDLNKGIAKHYQNVNSKRAVWADQTQVFGSVERGWKDAKELWGNTFGYVPILGNTGNILIGLHDAKHGMTANDRVGGVAGVVISSLLLAHEVIPAVVEAGLGEAALDFNASNNENYNWRYNSRSSDFELVRAPKTAAANHVPTIATEEPMPGTSRGTGPVNKSVPHPPQQSVSLRPLAQHAVPDAEELIKNANRDAIGVYRMTDSNGFHRQFVRITDETKTSRVFEIHPQHRLDGEFAWVINPKDRQMISVVTPGRDGEWARARIDAGLNLFGRREPSPVPSDSLNPRFSDLFADVDEQAVTQAKTFDEHLKIDEATHYSVSTRGFEDNGVVRRKLNLSWQGSTAEKVEIYDSEKARPTEYSASDYSPNFILDLNRNDYRVIKASKDGDVVLPLNAKGGSAEAIRQNRLKQFEDAIPDADLRARVSEVAHQGSVFPANAELLKTLKDGYGAKVSDTSYFVEYDPVKKETQVKVVAKWYFNDLTGDDPRIIPDIEATTIRTFTIRESNELSGDTYLIDDIAPTRLEISVPADLPE